MSSTKESLAGHVYEDEITTSTQLVDLCGRALLKYDIVEAAYKELATEEKISILDLSYRGRQMMIHYQMTQRMSLMTTRTTTRLRWTRV